MWFKNILCFIFEFDFFKDFSTIFITHYLTLKRYRIIFNFLMFSAGLIEWVISEGAGGNHFFGYFNEPFE